MSDQMLEFRSRLDSWSVDHPRNWSVQTDTTSLTSFLHAEFSRIIGVHIETASRASQNIIVSQERIAEGIDRVSFGIGRISDGLESLSAAFEWGFSELIWLVEQQRAILQGILEVLQKPLDTQAKELKARAESALREGLFDDALSDFEESEKKNRYDFTIHQSLGNIYLFEKKDPEKALECYEKAARYAKSKSPYHSSLAFLHIGIIRYLQGDFNGAYQATSQAIALTPSLYEAHYQHAQYCANLGKYNEALDHIGKAVEGDRNYSIKVYSEKDFNVMKRQLISFFTKMRNEKRSVAKKKTREIRELVEEAESLEKELSSHLESTKMALDRALKLMKRDSLFDCLDAISEANRCLDTFPKVLSEFTKNITEQIHKKTLAIRELLDRPILPGGKLRRNNWTAIYSVFGLITCTSAVPLAATFMMSPQNLQLRQYLLPVTIASGLITVISLVASIETEHWREKRELKSLEDDVAALRERLAKIARMPVPELV